MGSSSHSLLSFSYAMLQLQKIQDALLHVVGWEQDYNPKNAIEDELTQSESGLIFQGAHPLCTYNNVRSVMPQDWNYQYPKWNMLESYKKGDKVQHDGIIWIAIEANTNQKPAVAGDFNEDYSKDFNDPFWKPYNYVSDYLERMTRNGINKAITRFIQEKQLERETHSLVEHRTFFDGAGRYANTIKNSNKLVGYEITPVRANGVTTKIERIGLQFKGEGIVKMYLFHSSKIEPVVSFDLEYHGNGSFQWYNMKDLYMPYVGDTNAGGSWYLCYDQRALPVGMEAINISKDWSREPCATCNVGSLETWRMLTKYMQIAPFAVHSPTTFAEFPELWDVADMAYTNCNCYGINVEVSIGCDLTDFIIKQRHLFASVIQLQVVSDFIRTLAMNPDVRVNRNQSNASRLELLYEVDGSAEGRASGLNYELKKAFKALNIDTDGLDRVCLACNNHGVRYRTA